MKVFFSIYLIINGAKNIVRYTEDFVIWRFVISRFHLMQRYRKMVSTIVLDEDMASAII